MNCPQCKSITNLVHSRGLEETVKRLRKCSKCQHKFFTYEIPEDLLENPDELLETLKRG